MSVFVDVQILFSNGLVSGTEGIEGINDPIYWKDNKLLEEDGTLIPTCSPTDCGPVTQHQQCSDEEKDNGENQIDATNPSKNQQFVSRKTGVNSKKGTGKNSDKDTGKDNDKTTDKVPSATGSEEIIELPSDEAPMCDWGKCYCADEKRLDWCNKLNQFKEVYGDDINEDDMPPNVDKIRASILMKRKRIRELTAEKQDITDDIQRLESGMEKRKRLDYLKTLYSVRHLTWDL